jgi:hypothetical protein
MQWSVAEKEMWGSDFTQFVGLAHPAAERMEQNVIWPTRMQKLAAIYTDHLFSKLFYAFD